MVASSVWSVASWSALWLLPTCMFFVSLAAVYLWNLYVHYKYSAPDAPLPPGSMGLPWLGETIHFLIKGVGFYASRRAEHGEVYKTHLLGAPTVRVSGCELVRRIAREEGNLVESSWPESTRRLMGDSLSHCTDTNVHWRRRRAIAKAFDSKALNRYVKTMHDICARYMRAWSQESAEMLVYPECKKLIFEVAAKLLLGLNCDERQIAELSALYSDITKHLFTVPLEIPGSGFAKGMAARRKLLQILEDSLSSRDASSGTGSAMSLLVGAMRPEEGEEGGGGLSSEEVKEAAVELLLAGHETATSAVCTLVQQLALHPQVVDRVREELGQHHLLGHADHTELTLELVNRLSYVSSVQKEILRLLPPIGGVFRKVLKPFTINGYHIPKDWALICSIRETHQNGPSEFKPERWCSGNNMQDESKSLQYIPFGLGSRSCIGKEFAKLEIKVFIIELCRNYYWVLPSGVSPLIYMPVPHPKDGQRAKFISRHRNVALNVEQL